MTLTRADVADLRAGDVVEVAHADHPDVVTRGPLHDFRGALDLGGDYRIRREDGERAIGACYTLTVISRAKPPLYTNSDKTQPDPGDVVRDADSDSMWMAWYDRDGDWCNRRQNVIARDKLPDRLRLLVDGRTGLPPVQS